MALIYPGERGCKQASKTVTQEERGFDIRRRYTPRDVYAGLLYYARMRNWKDGWAAYAFVDLYGAFPSYADKQVEPISIIGTDLEEWCWARKRKKKAAAVSSHGYAKPEARPSKYNPTGDVKQDSGLMSEDDRGVDL